MNVSSSSDIDLSLDHMPTVGRLVSCVILGLSFLVGAPGNLLVIWTILRHVKQRSHTVVLILHMAVADLLVLITLPLWIYSMASSWVFGEASCKAAVYIINVCMYSSVYLITVMSVERILAVQYPLVMMRWRDRTAMDRMLMGVWLLAFLLGVPAISAQSLDEVEGKEQCLFREYSSLSQEVTYLCLETFGGFVIPFTIMAICYCLLAKQIRGMHFNTKHRTLVLISSVVAAFAVCWLPHHIINITELVCILAGTREAEDECVARSAIFISGALVFISSSVNPVLYVFTAKRFQGSLLESQLVKLFQEVAAHNNKSKGTSNDSDMPQANTINTIAV